MRTLFENTAFRRLFAGRLITNAGDSLYYIAAMWLVYDLGGSAFYTGLAGFLTLAPQALQFLTGPFVDRWRLRRILVGTQVAQGLLVLVIPLAAWTGRLSVVVVLVVMPVLSMLNQFVYPAQTAALPRIVESDDLVEANSAFSFAYQGVDLAFTAAGGILIALVGAVSLYLIDSVTFAAATLVFAGVRIPDAADASPDATDAETADAPDSTADADPGADEAGAESDSAGGGYLDELRDGVRYVRKSSLLIFVMAGSVVVNFTIGATMAVLPAFAALRGGPEAYGVLLSTIVGGILVGALAAGPLKRFSLASLSAVGFSVGGVLWLVGIGRGSLLATAALFALAWVPVGVTNVIFMAFIQSVVPEGLLGRVTSLTTSVSVAATPFGSLLGGAAGDAWGAPPVVAATGVGFLFIAGLWVVHPLLRDLPATDEVDPARYGLGSVE